VCVRAHTNSDELREQQRVCDVERQHAKEAYLSSSPGTVEADSLMFSERELVASFDTHDHHASIAASQGYGCRRDGLPAARCVYLSLPLPLPLLLLLPLPPSLPPFLSLPSSSRSLALSDSLSLSLSPSLASPPLPPPLPL
jgi:hypothetical protein